jgi:hypothetical protein
VIANLGRVDGMEEGHLDALIRGLCRVAGRDEPTVPEITYEPAKAFFGCRPWCKSFCDRLCV